MSDPNFPRDQRNASLPLWRRVRDYICELFNICGEPQELAAKHTLAFKDYKILLPWIRAGEALLRRFLLIEAALLDPQAPSPGAACPPKLQRRRTSPKHAHNANAYDLDPTNPASWPVSFRILSSSPACGGSGTRQSRETKGDVAANIRELSPRFRSTLPLARRLEAILRVYNNPMPFVRRLAARIRKAAFFIQRMLKDAWDKCRGLIARDFHDALGPCIAESARLLTDSS